MPASVRKRPTAMVHKLQHIVSLLIAPPILPQPCWRSNKRVPKRARAAIYCELGSVGQPAFPPI
jgi:hypothetical protein